MQAENQGFLAGLREEGLGTRVKNHFYDKHAVVFYYQFYFLNCALEASTRGFFREKKDAGCPSSSAG